MDERKFWVSVWALLAAVVSTLIIATTAYNVNKHRLIAAHPTPLELACAFDGDYSNLSQNCTVIALRPR